MFRKLFVFLIIAGLAASAVVLNKKSNSVTDVEKETSNQIVSNGQQKEIRGVWLSYKELGDLIRDKTEEEYRGDVINILENCKGLKLNTIFYHGRAFCDSLYFSEMFPLSDAVSGEKSLCFDPLECFLQEAEKYDIDVHLWLNPYRVSYKTKLSELPADSPAITLYKKDKSNILICEKGIYLNPAGDESRACVLKGVREALDKYNLSGIHFDDYFYPECNISGDKGQYEQYEKAGGGLSLKEWRCENVNALLAGVYSLVKNKNEGLVFSVSPCGILEKCKESYCADVKKWLNEEGFADFIIPQIYFGFENEAAPFENLVAEWEKAAENNGKLVLGMSAYKSGEKDLNAGSGKNEWVENNDILKRQYEMVKDKGCWQGFALFSYSYCFGEKSGYNSNSEIKNLKNMIE